MKLDEFTILKACSFKLDEEKICIATLQYHTETSEDGKTERSKSRYRWLARVVNLADVKAKIEELDSLENRLGRWTWPNDPSWNGFIATNDSTNERAASWLNCRLKKLVSWEDAQKILLGVKKNGEINKNSVYDTEDYICEDGSKISLTDLEALKTQLNKNMHKELHRNIKAKSAEENLKKIRSKTGPGAEVMTREQYEAIKKMKAG